MNRILYQIKRYYNKLIVEIQWLKYKYFHKIRTIPCGRNFNNKYLCCCQPMKSERVYLSNDNKECYCKVCNTMRVLSNHEININNPWG